MVTVAETQSELLVRSEELDGHPWLLNVLNGTIDLTTGQLRPHRREDFLTMAAPVKFSPGARSTVWESFLEKVIPNKEVRDFLQRITGYALTGSTKEEVLFFLHGPASSGKSTYLEALATILGDYSSSTSFKTFTTEGAGGNSASSDIARLAGKRLVRSSEIDKGDAFSEAVIKKLTGNDMITSRFLYKEYFEFRPEFKIFIASNDLARVRDDDSGLWRRLLNVPFAVGLGEKERDPGVKRTLLDRTETGPAILQWALTGCLEYQRIGLSIPDEVRSSTEGYRREMDPIAEFMEDCISANPLARVDNGVLWTAYSSWCLANGIKYGVSQKNLKRRLEQRGFNQHRDAKHRFWTGIRLRRDGESYVEQETIASTQAAPTVFAARVPRMTNKEFAEQYL